MTFTQIIVDRLLAASEVVGRSRFAEKGHAVRTNLKCNLMPSHPRGHCTKNHEVTTP
jgi:hypothetical protein